MPRETKRLAGRGMVALLLVLMVAGPILASEDTPGWYVGLGFGPNRTVFYLEDAAGQQDDFWLTGSSPELRVGRYLHPRFAIGLEARTSFDEIGTAGDSLSLQLKLRLTGHLWALAGTWHLGDPGTMAGRFFVRAGAGPAISNYALTIPDPVEPESGREIQARIDEWGWGVTGSVGYNHPVARHFAAGLQLSTNHLFIGGEVDRVWFGGLGLHLLWRF